MATPERFARIQDVFSTAVDLSGDDRRVYLERACGSDLDLRAEVEALLARDAELGGERSLADPAPPDPLVGSHIGPYRIERRIGSGGMGDVYLGERVEEFVQRVAIKVVTANVAGREDLLRRFRDERRFLASLDHPNIARLLDGGTTTDGRPFLVMEYVDGDRIDQYCDRRKLTIPARLHLFLEVCGAVAFAHQNQVVHRDIKPGNVLVSEDGVPKLLDFGIAKLIDLDPEPGDAGQTRAEHRALTWDYASPEQVRGERVGTTSDVYSLGVLLYEILTGRRPYTLDGLTLLEKREAVCEREPETPSTVVTREAADSGGPDEPVTPGPSEVSALRGCRVQELRAKLAGDLDGIVAKALRKDPAWRYSSVEGLAEDIRRHFEHRPVEAREDTFRYRTSKFLRRHRAQAVTVSLLLVVLAAGAVTSFVGFLKARAGEARAERNLGIALEAVDQMLTRVAEENLSQVQDVARVREDLLKDALSFSLRLLENEDQEGTLRRQVAAAHGRVAGVSELLGREEEAEQHYQEAARILGALVLDRPGDADLVADLSKTHNNLGNLYTSTGRFDEAADLHKRSVEAKEALVRSHPGEQRYVRDLGAGYHNLASLQAAVGAREEAEASYRLAISTWRGLMDQAPDSAVHRHNFALGANSLATLLHTDRRLEEAEPLYGQALAVWEGLVRDNPGDPDYRRWHAAVLNNLGLLYQTLDRTQEARETLETALSLRKALSRDHPDVVVYRNDVAATANNLGLLFHGLGQAPQAEAAHQEAIDVREQLVRDHPAVVQYGVDLAGSYNNMARLLRDFDQPARALAWYGRAIETVAREDLQRGRSARIVMCLAQWGRARSLGALGRHPEALADWEQALRSEECALRTGFHYEAAAGYALAHAAQPEGSPRREAYASRVVEILRQAQGAGYFGSPETVNRLKGDSAFDSLRSGAPFRTLMTELDGGLGAP